MDPVIGIYWQNLKTTIDEAYMKKTILNLLILLFLNIDLQAQYNQNGVVLEDYSETLTTGINPVTNELLEGSDWVLKKTAANRTNCNEFSDEIYLYKQVDVTKIDYTEMTNSCSVIPIVEDIDGVVSWTDMGGVQESFFDLETIVCGVGQSCGLNQNLQYENKFFSAINPTPGIDGTKAGNVDLIIYNATNIVNTLSDGSAGLGGVADLYYNPTSIKYCSMYRDASTDGRNSIYAKNPVLDMKIITWKAFNEGPSMPGGSNASTNSKSYILRGIDDTNRYLIGVQNILNQ